MGERKMRQARRQRFAFLLLAGSWISASGPCLAQNPSQAEIEQFLNSAPSQSFAQSGSYTPPPAYTARPAAMPQGRVSLRQLMQQMRTSQTAGQSAGLPASQATGQAAAMQNPFKLSRQEILRIMMGGSPSGTQPSYNYQAVGNSQQMSQVASDEASQAESAADRARYGDRWSRQNAAGQAQNHANAARAAADRATSAAAGGPPEAGYAAAEARNQAARAQAAANRAAAAAAGAEW